MSNLPHRGGAPWTGQAFARPLVLGAIVLLLFNDYVLKQTAPGLVSGKLSDVTGLFVLPLLLASLYEAGGNAAGRKRHIGDARSVAVAIAVSGVGFTFVKSSALGARWYSTSLSTLQWPLRTGIALLTSSPLPALDQVRVRADLTDLVALPVLFLSWRVAKRVHEAGGSTAAPPGSGHTHRRRADAM